MSESRQRLICRTLFVVCCALPTFFLVWSLLFVSSDKKWEAALQNQLGMESHVDAVVTPRPGVTKLKRVVIYKTTGEQLLTFPELTIQRSRTATTAVVAGSLELDSESLSTLLTQLAGRLQYRQIEMPMRVRFEQINLVRRHQNATIATRVQQLNKCVLECKPTETGQSIVFEFALADSDSSLSSESKLQSIADQKSAPTRSSNRCRLVVNAVRGELKNELRYELATNGCQIPCWILHDIAPQLKTLGKECSFSGSLLSGREATSIEGKLENIDLYQMITESFPHEMHGLASVELNKLLINENGIVFINGVFECTPTNGDPNTAGIGRGLLLAARDQLDMETPPGIDAPSVPFSLCRFEFTGRGKQFKIDGKCDDSGSVILDRLNQPMLHSKSEVLEVSSLMRTLLPDGHQNAFANRQCREIIAWFPDSTIR